MEGNIYNKAEQEAKRLTDLLEADQKKADPSVKPEWAAKIIGRIEKGAKEKLEMLKHSSNDEGAEEEEKKEGAQ